MKPFVRRHLPSWLRRLRAAGQLGTPTIVHADPHSWVATVMAGGLPASDPRLFDPILRRRDISREVGPQPLWSGYSAAGLVDYPLYIGADAVRSTEQVSIEHELGRYFTQVVVQRKPRLIVEVGAAFGGSGMYWLAGLEANGAGQLVTYEPNTAWADIARENLRAIGNRFDLVVGPFEDNVGAIDGRQTAVDIAFIDAIHTCEIVRRQVDLVTSRSSPGALIFLDDIDFSADMADCWDGLKNSADYAAAAEIGRVGVLELFGAAAGRSSPG